jgi:anti-sigma factor RsiW
MTMRDFDDETLMAYADGEADARTAAAVEAAMRDDDALAARVALFRGTREAVRAEARAREDEVPAALRRSVEQMVAADRERRASVAQTAEIAPLRRAANDDRPTWRRIVALPVAASLVAAVIAGTIGYRMAGQDAPLAGGVMVAGLGDGAIPAALMSTPSGEETELTGAEERLRAIATFRSADGRLCREFEVDSAAAGTTTVTVACHAPGGWQVNFAAVSPLAGDGYAPASSMDALDAYLDGIDAGQPLSEAEESEALRGLQP